ncbi:MAG TPA: type III pantothenate kinase [Steroidobacteraceae bacterium]|nr:type III pantothenate kinase [Steroidobacteraceae bacterium]
MNLLIDIGNSRIKWAWSDAGRVATDQISLAHGGEVGGEWLKLATSAGLRPERILVSNVAGARMAETLVRLSREAFSVSPDFAAVAAAAAGVTCAYRDPSQLGVDRWLAVIGAWTRAKRAVCVLDCGTATTVDAVDGDGLHLGGVILPGLDLMEDALLKRTSDISRVIGVAARAQATLFADNTAAAVRNGAAFATAALTERAATELERRSAGTPVIYVTGGNATRVAPCLLRAHEVVPDLVLQGLAAWAR